MLTLPWVSSSPDRDRLETWRTRGASTRVTPPSTEPVSLAFAKTHGQVYDTTNDQTIEFRLRAAREWAERYTGRAFMRQTWDWTILDGDITHAGPLLLSVVPVISVASITSYNAAGAGTVMSNTTYFLDAASAPARVLLNEGSAWPSGLRAHNSLVVRYVAGYGTDGASADAVPESIRHAILLLASEWYERVEAATDQSLVEVPFGVRALLDPFRVQA